MRDSTTWARESCGAESKRFTAFLDRSIEALTRGEAVAQEGARKEHELDLRCTDSRRGCEEPWRGDAAAALHRSGSLIIASTWRFMRGASG